MSGKARPLHVHVENRREQSIVYHVTRERFDDALGRHGDIADGIEASIGFDLESFDDEIATTDVLVLPVPVPADWRPRLYALAETAPRLRFVFQTGAGAERLFPLDWLPPGVPMTNNSGAHAEKAREYVTMAILMLNNRIPALATAKNERRWDEAFSAAVRGKTALVVGVGHMGGAAAEAAKRLGLRVLGVRASGEPHPQVDEMVTPDRLAEVLPRADFVIATTPLTEASRGLIGARELDLLKPTAGLVNMGRAAVVDYDALAARLADGRLAGAVLDVFEPEPLPPDSALWETPNLVITPHTSSDDDALYIANTLDVLFDNLGRHLAGDQLINHVDPERGY